VRRGIQAMRVEYPIAVDNDYAIWNGFSNQYWPALYLIDEKGQFGSRTSARAPTTSPSE